MFLVVNYHTRMHKSLFWIKPKSLDLFYISRYRNDEFKTWLFYHEKNPLALSESFVIMSNIQSKLTYYVRHIFRVIYSV